jgi:hypothetical protein
MQSSLSDCSGVAPVAQPNGELGYERQGSPLLYRQKKQTSRGISPAADGKFFPSLSLREHLKLGARQRVAKRITDLQYWQLLAFSINIAKLGKSLGVPSAGSVGYQRAWTLLAKSNLHIGGGKAIL